MNDGLRRLSVLLLVFTCAFAAVVLMRKLQNGDGFSGLWPWGKKDSTEFRPEKFTLPEGAPLDLDDVAYLTRLNAEYAKLSDVVRPAVVSIDTVGVKRERLRDLFGQVWERRSSVTGIGSGVIVTKEGHVVTNNHVISDKTKIRVTLADGKTYPALLIGQDPSLDIAVLRIESDREFNPLSFGDSERVRTGEMAFAIGNPFGLGETITKGIISAKERSLSDTQRDLFQTDAAINPGNSGGPLVNVQGQIIGINVAIYSPDTQNRGFHGVGFSLPSNDVRESFLQILEKGRPVRGYLGVKALDLNAEVRRIVNYPTGKGAVVFSVVPGSPAEQAGLRPEDVIVKYAGHEVESRQHLFTMIQRSKVDTDVPIQVLRDGKGTTMTASIVDSVEGQAAAREEPAGRSPGDQEILEAIGLKVRDLRTIEQRFGASGVLVVEVLPGSLTDKSGLRPGDLIVGLNDRRVDNANEFFAGLLASAAAQQTVLTVRRTGSTYRVGLPRVPRTSEQNP